MATVEQLVTEVLTIGGPGDQITAGDTWQRSFPRTDPQTCVPVDFTGWTPVAEVVDSGGTVLETATVTPSPGDDTGIFLVELTPAQTAVVPGTNTLRLRVSLGGDVKTTFCATYIITPCP